MPRARPAGRRNLPSLVIAVRDFPLSYRITRESAENATMRPILTVLAILAAGAAGACTQTSASIPAYKFWSDGALGYNAGPSPMPAPPDNPHDISQVPS